MEDFARAALAGIAIGGLATAVVEANLLAVKALWRFNRLATETAWEMSQGLVRGQIERIRRWMEIEMQRISDEVENKS